MVTSSSEKASRASVVDGTAARPFAATQGQRCAAQQRCPEQGFIVQCVLLPLSWVSCWVRLRRDSSQLRTRVSSSKKTPFLATRQVHLSGGDSVRVEVKPAPSSRDDWSSPRSGRGGNGDTSSRSSSLVRTMQGPSMVSHLCVLTTMQGLNILSYLCLLITADL